MDVVRDSSYAMFWKVVRDSSETMFWESCYRFVRDNVLGKLLEIRHRQCFGNVVRDSS